MVKEESILVTERKGIKKGIYIIPSIFTVGNMLCGFYAIINSIKATQVANLLSLDQSTILFDHAAKAIGVAWLLDGLDGRIARMTNATSEFGVELDSIADVLSFGVAPAVLAYAWGYGAIPGLEKLGWVSSSLFLICGALRLARFNVMARSPRFSYAGGSPKLDKRFFVGLPIPAAAGGIVALIHFTPIPLVKYPYATASLYGQLLLVLMFLLAVLMVSNLKYASFKDIGLKSNKPFVTLPLIAILATTIWLYSHWVILAVGISYIGHGIVLKVWSLVSRRRRGTVNDEAAASNPHKK